MPQTNINTGELIHSFLMKLREEGFSVGTENFIQTTKLYQWFNAEKRNEPVAAFASYLGPVICKSDEEQARFGQLFNIHFKKVIDEFEEQEKEIKKKRRKKTLFVIITLICLAVLLLYIFFPVDSRPSFNFSNLLNQQLYVHKLDTVDIKTDTVFENKKDTAGFEITCTFSDGSTKKGTSLRHAFARYGKDSFRIRYKSAKHNIDTTLLFKNVFTGPEKRNWITPEKETAFENEEIGFSTDADTVSVKDIYWMIDSLRLNYKTKNIRHRFPKSGNHEIKVGYDVEKEPYLEDFPKDFTEGIYIQKISSDSVRLTATPAPLPPQLNTSLNTAWLLALLAMALTLIIAAIKILKKKPLITLYNCSEENFGGSNEPYTIPFISKEQNIAPTYALQRLSNDLRKRTESQSYSINYDRTIRASISNRGFITPQFTQKQINREYLFLIDQAYANSQQVKLFTYLLTYFVTRSVQADFYFYHQQPDKFYTQTGSAKITADRLRDMHYNATLVFITEGSALTNYQKPEVKTGISSTFGFWQNRLLVTPVPANDWSGNERILNKFFKLLPADIQGLMELVKIIEEDSSPALAQLKDRFISYTSKHEDFNDTESLKEYLNDEELFQWLCAAAILPKIYWEFFLETGKNIVSDKSKINYSTLLKLVRIKWVHEGVLPPALRLELLKQLTVTNELTARETLLKMLDETALDETAFSYEEKQLLKYQASFILYASGSGQYQNNKSIEEGEQKFLCLYKNKKLADTPFKIYVENKPADGHGWQTPIETAAGDKSIDSYIHEKEAGLQKEIKAQRRKKNSVSSSMMGVAICILLGIIALFSNKDNIAKDETNIFRQFVDTAWAKNDTVKARILPGECFNQFLKNYSDSNISLQVTGNGTVLYKGIVKINDAVLVGTGLPANINAGMIDFTVNAGSSEFKTTTSLQPGLFDIALTGQCESTGKGILAVYSPGYNDDTSFVINLLKKEAGSVEIKDFSKAEKANRILFSSNIDTVTMHRICTGLINAGFPLKQIMLQTAGSGQLKKITVDGAAVFDKSPVLIKDSVDCFFKLKKDCGIPPPQGKSSLLIYYNNRDFESKIKQLASCITGRGISVTQTGYINDPTAKQSYIDYYRNSFADSLKWIQACAANISQGTITPQKVKRPFANNAAAVLYLYEAPALQPVINIEYSDESLRNSAERFLKELASQGYKTGSIVKATRNYNSVIEYYNQQLQQQALQVQNIYRKYFPDLPVQTRLLPTGAAGNNNIVIWIRKYEPVQTAQPAYRIQNVKFPYSVSAKEKLSIAFEVSIANKPANVAQNNTAPGIISGQTCINSQKRSCTGFTISDGNGIKPVKQGLDISNNEPGRHSIRIAISQFKIDTTVGYFSIREIPESNGCDTITANAVVDGKSNTGNVNLKNFGLSIRVIEKTINGKVAYLEITKEGCKPEIKKLEGKVPVTIRFCNGTQAQIILTRWNNALQTASYSITFTIILCKDAKQADAKY